MGWRRTRLNSLVTLRNHLLHIRPPTASRGNDTFIWDTGHTNCQDFSTKRTWNLIRPVAPTKQWAKIIWFKGFVSRHAFNLWTAHLDRLPTRSRLANWGMNIPVMCCLCNLLMETRCFLALRVLGGSMEACPPYHRLAYHHSSSQTGIHSSDGDGLSTSSTGTSKRLTVWWHKQQSIKEQ